MKPQESQVTLKPGDVIELVSGRKGVHPTKSRIGKRNQHSKEAPHEIRGHSDKHTASV